jgi:hypothetical protein
MGTLQSMTATTTIRVSLATRDAVNRVRAETGESTDSILEKALAAYEESMFWRRWREVYGTSESGPHGFHPDEDMADWEAASAFDLGLVHAAADPDGVGEGSPDP